MKDEEHENESEQILRLRKSACLNYQPLSVHRRDSAFDL